MILVTFYTSPGVNPQERTDQHEQGFHIVTNQAGVLEVRNFMGRVLKAYAPGVWIKGWVQE